MALEDAADAPMAPSRGGIVPQVYIEADGQFTGGAGAGRLLVPC